MASACLPISSSSRRPGNPGAVLFLALLAAAVGLVWAILVGPEDHAQTRHGSDAVAIRQCIDRNGPYQVWRGKDKETWYLTCQLPDGRWGVRSVIWDKALRAFFEKTAFVPEDGAEGDLLGYLAKWGTRWNGPLPRGMLP